jgi:crotonobetainyl-CoA:carnitine CoA-transferase CaiB-like acyl-CoA transferase
MVSFLETMVLEYLMFGRVMRRLGNRRPISTPVDAYEAQDGYVYIIATPEKAWQALLKLMGREELLDDPRLVNYKARAAYADMIEPMVANWVAGYKVKELVEMLVEAGIPCAPVLSVDEVTEDPQIRSRQMIVEVEHPKVGKLPVLGIVPKLSATPGEVGRPPLVGEHNGEIYGGLLGLSMAEIETSREEGII